jgi:transposase
MAMASIQAKTSHGHTYWYLVESRRVNGKPRPVVLEYLGKPEDLLRRLREPAGARQVKSYSHGAVAALLDLAGKLDVVSLINESVRSSRPYMAPKPTRHGLTVGMTLLLGAIGRVCMPTSKRGWWTWAKTTSCERLLRCSLRRIDSQHFWDLMDALPAAAIPRIEAELLRRVQALYPFDDETLLFDTTNFFTFIATTNARCSIAQRGKNKQKRGDLRQVGLALAVTRRDGLPLFHLTYEGALHDAKVFPRVLGAIRERMAALRLDPQRHTLVFDRGMNSKKNLELVEIHHIHYVGALTPYHHRALLEEAHAGFRAETLQGQTLQVYRTRKLIWGQERTVVVFVSERLKAGQLRGVYQALERKQTQLRQLQRSLDTPRGAMRDPDALAARIASLTHGQFLEGLIDWTSNSRPNGTLGLDFSLNAARLRALEDKLGVRILMTDRHEWTTQDILQAFHGQAAVEGVFKDIKNPHHLALRPQHHWTDQKILVHYFLCILGYLLAALLLRQARVHAQFSGTLDSLLDQLNNIRLATLLEPPKGRGRPKATQQLEERTPEEDALLQALGIAEAHQKPLQIQGVGVSN